MTKSYKREKGTKRSTRRVSAEKDLKVPMPMNSIGEKVLAVKYLIPLFSTNTTICIGENDIPSRLEVIDTLSPHKKDT